MSSNHKRESSKRNEREGVGIKDFFPFWSITVNLDLDNFTSQETLGNVRRYFLIITTSDGPGKGEGAIGI